MRAFILVITIVAVLFIGIMIGYFIWYPTLELPSQLSYEVLKDTLTIVLTFTAILIAVSGVAVYRIVSDKLEKETGQRIAEESKRSIAWLAALVGNKFWDMKKKGEAIKVTEEAYEYVKELDERDSKNQLLLGEIRNNLACYYVQTNQKAKLAKGYAAYIHNISDRFPEKRETWEKTFEEVKEAFPD